jgi:asparagine synthase (glutamine-hydrolysing)
MCGIVAVCFNDPNSRVDQRRFRAATDLQTHRGPDEGSAEFYSGAALGTRRLAIIDLAMGQQPISDPSNRYHITYNGELYNFRELRQSLEKRGVIFQTDCDTEVVLMAYVLDGPKCLKTFNGMFGFAIWDSVERTMFVARDRIGIKPLFYAVDDERLIVSSETVSVRALIDGGVSVRPDALNYYLAYRSIAAPDTFYQEISQLLPGHFLLYKDGRIRVQSYWEIPSTPADITLTEDQAVEHFRKLFGKSVERRLVSDVPVTAFLSGGLDSSVAVAEMADRYSGTINTFTIGIEGGDLGGDLVHARSVADMYGTRHTEISLSPDDFVAQMEPLTALRDAPLSVPNEVMIASMAHSIRDYGKVVLSGEGADELFGGYGRIFRSALDWERMHDASRDVGGATRRVAVENLATKYGAVPTDNMPDFFVDQYAYNGIAERSAVLAEDFWSSGVADDSARATFHEAFSRVSHLEPQAQFLSVFLRLHLPSLLERLDRSTMTESVEARVPFLDHELIEFAQSCPINFKMRWNSRGAEQNSKELNSSQYSEKLDMTKWLIKAAYRDRLPSGVVDRVKVGFPSPLNTSLREPLYKLAREVLLDKSTVDSGFFNRDEIEQLVLSEDRDITHQEAHKVWQLTEIGLWYKSVATDSGLHVGQ